MAAKIKVDQIETVDATDSITINNTVVMASGKTLPAASLTGTLPAISGANLTNLPVQTTDISGKLNLAGGTMTGDLILGDNVKLEVGSATGGDLQIYHDGNNSYIDDAGTGALTIRSNTINLRKYTGETLAEFQADGAVTLRYDNVSKFQTTAAGATVTGTLSATLSTGAQGNITSLGALTSDLGITKASAKLIITSTGSGNDASVLFATPSNSRGMYLDDSDSNKLKFYTGHGKGAAGKEITFDNDGKVGIGTTAPLRQLHISNTSGNSEIAFTSGTSGVASLLFGDGLTGTDVYKGYVQYQHNGDYMLIATGATTRLRVDSDGLKFNADTAAANALDDYEEGTWTPTITFSSSAPNVTLGNINAGHYTKIGDTVHFHMTLHVNAYNSGSGNLIIGGLPFAHTSTYTKRFITASLSADHLNWESDWVAVNLTNATGGTTGFTYTAQRDNAASEYIAQANYPTGNTYHFATGHYYTDS